MIFQPSQSPPPPRTPERHPHCRRHSQPARRNQRQPNERHVERAAAATACTDNFRCITKTQQHATTCGENGVSAGPEQRSLALRREKLARDGGWAVHCGRREGNQRGLLTKRTFDYIGHTTQLRCLGCWLAQVLMAHVAEARQRPCCRSARAAGRGGESRGETKPKDARGS